MEARRLAILGALSGFIVATKTNVTAFSGSDSLGGKSGGVLRWEGDSVETSGLSCETR
jgi:hypothetical protein